MKETSLPIVKITYVSPSGEYVSYTDPGEDIIYVSRLDGTKVSIDLDHNMYLREWIDNTHFRFMNYGSEMGSTVEYIGDVNGNYVPIEPIPPTAYFPCFP